MKVTKRKDSAGWRIQLDGRDTPILIDKGGPPRFREPQEWIAFTDNDDVLFRHEGTLLGCVKAIERIVGIVAECR